MTFSKKDVKVSNKQITFLITKLDENYSVKKIKPISEGLANPAYIINTSKEDLVLRIIHPSNGEYVVKKEEVIYNLLSNKKIPVPKIIKTDISKKLIPYNYAISKRLEGNSLRKNYEKLSFEEKRKIFKQLGNYLSKMHSITFNKFGDIIKKGNRLLIGPLNEIENISKTINSGPFYSWKDMHKEIIKARLRCFKGTQFEKLIKPIKTYFSEHQNLIDYDITPRLLHIDLNKTNIFVNGGKVTGILDVGDSFIGHNEEDLMRTELDLFNKHHGGEKQLKHVFLEEYEKNIKLDKGYEERLPFYFLSRSCVGLGCLIQWPLFFTKKSYQREKNWLLDNIKKITQ